MNTAQAGAEGFVWLIVGIFWIISQMAGAAAKKKRSEQALSEEESENGQRPEEDRVDGPRDPLAELMRKLAGTTEFRIPDPPKPVTLPTAARHIQECDIENKPLPDSSPPPRSLIHPAPH